MRLLSLLTACTLLLASSARAEEGPHPALESHATSPARDADAYCRWVRAGAASDSDVLLAPQVYATVGFVDEGLTAPGTASVPTNRVITAALYSFGALNHGLALRAQAMAECKRYETTAKLRAFVERNRDDVSVRGLTAKAKELDAALDHATELLARERTDVAAARLSVEELQGTQLRVDTLRNLAAATHVQLAAFASAPATPVEPVPKMLAARDAAEQEAEKQTGRLRAANGWDLTVRGGYDRILGVRQDLPFFAQATLSVSLGWFFQGSNNSDARAARRDWVRAEVEGLDDRVEQVMARLRGSRQAELVNLRNSTALLADLESRYKTVSVLAGDHARIFADYVWFDLIRVRGEHAYLVEHVRDLDALLGETATAP